MRRPSPDGRFFLGWGADLLGPLISRDRIPMRYASRTMFRFHPGKLLDAVHSASRRRKFDRLMEALEPTPESTFLEVGVGNEEPLPVTNYVARNYPWPERVTALGLGDVSGFRALHPDIHVVSYDGGVFPFPNGAFDVVHSNAVIEHVGSEESQLAFLRECLRVGRSGMITTPNRFFPIESHTLLPLVHWLGKARFDKAIAIVGPERIARGFARLGRRFPIDELENLRLLGAPQLRRLLVRAGARHAKVMKNRVGGLPMTLTVLWRD